MNMYWKIDNFRDFSNIEVHGIVGDIKYLCCLNCQFEIIGFQFISVLFFFLMLFRTQVKY